MEAQFFRFLKIVGVGFKARAESEGRLLFLKLGYSHEVELSVPPAVRVFCFKPNIVCCTGIDKQRVHQFAAAVRSCKPPEVYKGKATFQLLSRAFCQRIILKFFIYLWWRLEKRETRCSRESKCYSHSMTIKHFMLFKEGGFQFVKHTDP
ncbi:unnamed protein product [Lactuca virosa]|uniref:Large ribosomal subunit protein uL6 alpha-beta domain-containing protein n=1 Tax=Lactuca virosa TaxID=75947 RepID=A0AAU9LVD4_9ASTR|nr:unnamed protein product [Lactuca virosa]